MGNSCRKNERNLTSPQNLIKITLREETTWKTYEYMERYSIRDLQEMRWEDSSG
jgi:hypothetical protein